jgi:hypothetical protein
MLIPDYNLKAVASYSTRFDKTIADLREDSNYVVSATENDRNILIKIETYRETNIFIANSCDSKNIPSLMTDDNKEGLYSLTPIYEDTYIYLSSDEKVFVYDTFFRILGSGQNFIHVNKVKEENLYFSRGSFVAAFASDGVGI